MNREKFMDCLAEYLGVQKYEEFKLVANNFNYRIADTRLEILKGEFWVESVIGFDVLKRENVRKLPWKPKKGERYWFIDMFTENGYAWFVNNCDMADEKIINRGEIFKTEEEAKERVKELGW